MIVTLVATVLVVWAGVAIAAGIAIGRAMRLADKAADYVEDPDGRPIHVSRMTFVPDEWAVTE